MRFLLWRLQIGRWKHESRFLREWVQTEKNRGPKTGPLSRPRCGGWRIEEEQAKTLERARKTEEKLGEYRVFRKARRREW